MGGTLVWAREGGRRSEGGEVDGWDGYWYWKRDGENERVVGVEGDLGWEGRGKGWMVSIA